MGADHLDEGVVRRLPGRDMAGLILETVARHAEQARRRLLEANTPRRKALLSAIVNRIDVYDDKLRIRGVGTVRYRRRCRGRGCSHTCTEVARRSSKKCEHL